MLTKIRQKITITLGDFMSAKEKKKLSKIVLLIAIFTLLIIAVYIKYISNKESYAANDDKGEILSDGISISDAKEINLEDIIQKNTKNPTKKKKYMKKKKN